MVHRCCVCKWHGNKEPRRSFHTFPRDIIRKRQWLQILGRKWATPRTVVCSAHFKKECFEDALVCGRIRLKKDSLPFLSLPENGQLKNKQSPCETFVQSTHAKKQQIEESPLQKQYKLLAKLLRGEKLSESSTQLSDSEKQGSESSIMALKKEEEQCTLSSNSEEQQGELVSTNEKLQCGSFSQISNDENTQSKFVKMLSVNDQQHGSSVENSNDERQQCGSSIEILNREEKQCRLSTEISNSEEQQLGFSTKVSTDEKQQSESYVNLSNDEDTQPKLFIKILNVKDQQHGSSIENSNNERQQCGSSTEVLNKEEKQCRSSTEISNSEEQQFGLSTKVSTDEKLQSGSSTKILNVKDQQHESIVENSIGKKQQCGSSTEVSNKKEKKKKSRPTSRKTENTNSFFRFHRDFTQYRLAPNRKKKTSTRKRYQYRISNEEEEIALPKFFIKISDHEYQQVGPYIQISEGETQQYGSSLCESSTGVQMDSSNIPTIDRLAETTEIHEVKETEKLKELEINQLNHSIQPEQFLVVKKKINVKKKIALMRRHIRRLRQRKEQLKSHIKELEEELKERDARIELMSSNLGPIPKALISQLTATQKNAPFFPLPLKVFASTVSFLSEKTYRYMQKVFPSLPHISTVRSWHGHISPNFQSETTTDSHAVPETNCNNTVLRDHDYCLF